MGGGGGWSAITWTCKMTNGKKTRWYPDHWQEQMDQNDPDQLLQEAKTCELEYTMGNEVCKWKISAK